MTDFTGLATNIENKKHNIDLMMIFRNTTTHLLAADVSGRKQQLISSFLDDAQVLQQVLVGDALVRAQHVVDGALLAVDLAE